MAAIFPSITASLVNSLGVPHGLDVCSNNFGASLGKDKATNTAAFQAAFDAASYGATITIPAGVWDIGAISNPSQKSVRWQADGASAAPGNTLFTTLPGIVTYGFGAPQLLVQNLTGPTDFAAFAIRRNTNYTGGTPGYVNSGFRVDHTVGSDTNRGATSFEWAVVGVMNNWADAGENVGGYFQGNKYGTGPTWGGLFEVVEKNVAADPMFGTIGAEIDVNAYGGDARSNRLVLDLVLRRPVGDEGKGARAEALTGIRFSAESGTPNSLYYNLITTVPNMQARIGLNLSNASIIDRAIALAADQSIAFENSGVNNLRYSSSRGAMSLTTSGGMTIDNASHLPATQNASVPLLTMRAFDENTDELQIKLIRKSPTSDWGSAVMRIGRVIDSTLTTSYLEFRPNAIAMNRVIIDNLQNAANDAAAAAAGVMINEVYRNGNALMIRLA